MNNNCGSRAVSISSQPPLGGHHYSILCEVNNNFTFKSIVHHLRSQVFSHVVVSVFQIYTTLRIYDISWASQYGEHIPEVAMKFLKAGL